MEVMAAEADDVASKATEEEVSRLKASSLEDCRAGPRADFMKPVEAHPSFSRKGAAVGRAARTRWREGR